MVGDGSAIPVTSVGDSVLPDSFRLHNVLVAPTIVWNLLSVRQFTIENSCSIKFDPFGLSVKDLTSQRLLARYDSVGPLYTLRLPAASAPASPPLLHALATTASSVTWHRRLGHPGADALSKLACSSAISCTRGTHESLCHACQLGRYVHLPFASSTSQVVHPFALIHCDLWTSPILSVSGYKFYLVIVDDFSHYSWTSPLRLKSDTFKTLSHFFAWVFTQFSRTVQASVRQRARVRQLHLPFFLPHPRHSAPYVVLLHFRSEQQGRAYDSYHERHHVLPAVPGLSPSSLLG